MSDEQDGGAKCLIEVSQYAQNLGLYGHVERSGGLVGNNQIWPACQGLGNGDSMQLSAAKLMRESSADPVDFYQLNLAQDRLNLQFARLTGKFAVRENDLSNLIAHTHYGAQCKRRLLVNQGYPGATNSP